MARPQKEGLDYFPVDIDIDQDDKLIVPIAIHGMLGFGVIVMLMKEIYKNGYFYSWTKKEIHIFPFKVHVEVEKVCEIVADCIESGFFSEDQMVRNNILTSYGFQKRYLLASSRRKESIIDPRFEVKSSNPELLPTETELLHTLTEKMSAKSTQSKVKEIKEKVKEIKVNKTKEKIENILYGDYVQMTLIQYEKLITDFGHDTTQKYILSIDDWFAQDINRLKKYSDHSRMVRTWKRNDDSKHMASNFNKNSPKSKGTQPTEIEQYYARLLKEEQDAAV